MWFLFDLNFVLVTINVYSCLSAFIARSRVGTLKIESISETQVIVKRICLLSSTVYSGANSAPQQIKVYHFNLAKRD